MKKKSRGLEVGGVGDGEWGTGRQQGGSWAFSPWANGSAIHRNNGEVGVGVKFSFGHVEFQMSKKKH